MHYKWKPSTAQKKEYRELLFYTRLVKLAAQAADYTGVIALAIVTIQAVKQRQYSVASSLLMNIHLH